MISNSVTTSIVPISDTTHVYTLSALHERSQQVQIYISILGRPGSMRAMDVQALVILSSVHIYGYVRQFPKTLM